MTREQQIELVKKLAKRDVGTVIGAELPEDKKSVMPGVMSVLAVIGGFFAIRGLGRWFDRGARGERG